MLISCDVNTNIVNGVYMKIGSVKHGQDILFEVLVWEQIKGCSGKFMSAPVDAAIARDTLVKAGVVVWIGTSARELSLSAPASTFEMGLCFPSLIAL